jgi:predicted DNA binding CopG/RHH family protein
MKRTKQPIYKDEPEEEGWHFDPTTPPLTEAEKQKLGIPTVAEAQAHLKRKLAKEERINLRLSSETLTGLKQRAQEAGMPYQTLAASALHMLATGKLRLALVTGGK